MTVLAGVVHDGRCYLAADSAVSSGQDSITTCGTPKVWLAGDVVLGVAGDLVARDIVRYHVEVPPFDGGDAHAYVARELVPAVRAALRGAQAADSDHELLVGVCGQLMHVDSAGGATRWACGYGAAGSGADLALGALHATAGLAPLDRLRAALEAAAQHNSSVRPPWVYVPA